LLVQQVAETPRRLRSVVTDSVLMQLPAPESCGVCHRDCVYSCAQAIDAQAWNLAHGRLFLIDPTPRNDRQVLRPKWIDCNGEQRAHQQHDSRIQCSSRTSSRVPHPIPRPRAVDFVPCWPLQAPHRDLSSRDSNEALFQYEHPKMRRQRQTNTVLRLSSQWCGAGSNSQCRRSCRRKSLLAACLTLA
jgi:hypothetical protein